MNEHLLKQIGFTREIELVKEGKCPVCEIVVVKNFRDKKSLEKKES